MRFVIDEDLPPLLRDVLRQRGHEAYHVRDLGLCGRPDIELFNAAQHRNSIVVSGDWGFGNLVQFPLGTHAGIVVADYPSKMRTRDLAGDIAEILCGLGEENFSGCLVILEPNRIRVRRPLSS